LYKHKIFKVWLQSFKVVYFYIKKCNYLLSASLITGKLLFSAAHQSKCNLIGYDTTKSFAVKPGAAGLLCEEIEGENFEGSFDSKSM